MMLLDCTLRDGGYYNNWNFEDELIDKYLAKINYLPIDYIEVGYLSPKKKGFYGKLHYVSCEILRQINKNSSKKIAVMIDFKEIRKFNYIEQIKKIKKYISLIRLAIKPEDISSADKYIKIIKKENLKVALNVMYCSKIKDSEFFINDIKKMKNYPDFLYLVDSYGNIFPDELEELIKNIKKNINVKIGFHGHNNVEMAFANSLKALESGVEILDSTLLGMGRGAGNLKTELILSYLKKIDKKKVNLDRVMEACVLFEGLLKQYKWGTNLAYVNSGLYNQPQKDVMVSLEKQRYSITGIIRSILEKKDSSLKKFKPNNKIKFHDVIIIGGGSTVKSHLSALLTYLKENKKAIIIHSTIKYLNYFKKVSNYQVLSVSGDTALKVKRNPKLKAYIYQPQPRKIKSKKNKNSFEIDKYSFLKNQNADSPLAVSLEITLKIKAKNIYIIGFDGYKNLDINKNYYLSTENQYLIDEFTARKKLISLTPTLYSNISIQSVYQKIT